MLVLLAFLTVVTKPTTAAGGEVCELSRQRPGATSSRGCMSCHDGSIAPVADVTFPAAGWTAGPTEGSAESHPVDVDYEQAALRRPGYLRPSASLPPTVELPGGRVTCLSCHSPSSTLPSQVSVTVAGSALCLACHPY